MRKLSCHGGIRVLVLLFAAAQPAHAQSVAGRVTVTDRGERAADDVGQAVVWLEATGLPRGGAQRVEIATEGKQFLPHAVVVPLGSTVSFPNHDPFNHNVFSLSEEGPFDLGLYGRGQAKQVRFDTPGIVKVYCNVHATMSAFVVVTPGALATRPGADGRFELRGVRPGDYVIHAWHERAALLEQALTVPADGVHDLPLALDARGFVFSPHLDKTGKPYRRGGRRY